MTQTPTLTGSESLSTISLNDKIVQASKEVKLIYSPNLKAEFMAIIIRVSYLLGVTPDRLPNQDQVNELFNFAKEKWFNYTLPELELAIKSNIAMELDSNAQFNGYITAAYIAECLKNYNDAKRKAILRAKALEQNQVPREIATSDREHFTFIQDWYIEHKSFPMGDYHHAFDYAWKENLFANYDLKKWMEDRKDQIIAEICSEKRVGDDIKERNLIEKMFSEDSMKLRLRKESLQMLIRDTCQ